MEFILLLLADRNAPDDPSVYPEMGRFAGELAATGKLRGGAPLHPEAMGARVREGVASIGPFTSEHVIGGYFLVDCKNRDEAIEVAKRCPHARVGVVEVRQVIPMGGPPTAPKRRANKPARAAGKKKSAKKSPARRKKR
jgi:hypothetical protein